MSTFDTTRNNAGAITFSGGNLTCSATGGNNSAFGTLAHSTGKWNFRMTAVSLNLTNSQVGMGNATATSANYLGSDANSFGCGTDGTFTIANSNPTTTGVTYAVGNTIDLAVDIPNKVFWIRSSSSTNWNGNASYVPGDAHGISISLLSSFSLFPAAGLNGGSGNSFTANFATPPSISGFNAWDYVAASCLPMSLLGVGCMIGWTPALLRCSVIGGAAIRLGRAVRRNATISRRSLFTTLND